MLLSKHSLLLAMGAAAALSLTACSEGGSTDEETPAEDDDADDDDDDTVADDDEPVADDDEPVADDDEPADDTCVPLVRVDDENHRFSDYPRDPPYDWFVWANEMDGFRADLNTEEGRPDAPSYQLDIPFDYYGQVVELNWTLSEEDLSGKELVLPIKHVSGGNTDPSCPMGLKFFIKTGADYVYGQREWLNLTESDQGSWKRVIFDVDNAEPADGLEDEFDPSTTVEIGFSFETGDCGTTKFPRETDAKPAADDAGAAADEPADDAAGDASAPPSADGGVADSDGGIGDAAAPAGDDDSAGDDDESDDDVSSGDDDAAPAEDELLPVPATILFDDICVRDAQ